MHDRICSPSARWVDQKLNDRYFTFIKRGAPGLVLFVRKNAVLELELAPNTILLIVTAHSPVNENPSTYLLSPTKGDYYQNVLNLACHLM